jgi:hypothetical protein
VAVCQDQHLVGVLDSLREQAAFEYRPPALDAGFKDLGKFGALRGHGQIEDGLGLKDHTLILNLDRFYGDRSQAPEGYAGRCSPLPG